MPKEKIVIGSDFRTRYAEGLVLVEGTLVHPSPTDPESLTVSHRSSGLSLVQGLTKADMPEVIELLGDADWTLPPEVISKSNIHYAIIEEIVLSNKERSAQQEKRIAKDTDGKVQPGSGAVWGYRRDVVTPLVLIEAKTTENSSFSIKLKDLSHLATTAYMQGKTPVYLVEINHWPELAVIPKTDIPFEVIPTHTAKPSKTAVRLTEEMAKNCSDHSATYEFKTEKMEYAIIDYYRFLDMVKPQP